MSPQPVNSLKAKFVLALVLTSLLVALLVAVITPIMVEHKLLEDTKKTHYARFSAAIVDYQQRYRSWGTAEDARRFANIAEQGRQRSGAPGPRPGFGPGPGRDFGAGSGPSGFISPPPPGLIDGGELPFKFALFDHTGNVLHKGKGFQVGQQVGQAVLDDSDPLTHQGTIIGYALAEGELPLTKADESYLHTLEETLLFALLLSIALVVPLGIWEGNRLVGTLKHLTKAVDRMADGHLQQKVPTQSRDEIGALAVAFNSMNDKLVEAYRH